MTGPQAETPEATSGPPVGDFCYLLSAKRLVDPNKCENQHDLNPIFKENERNDHHIYQHQPLRNRIYGSLRWTQAEGAKYGTSAHLNSCSSLHRCAAGLYDWYVSMANKPTR